MFEAPTEEQLADFKTKYGNDMRVVEIEDMVFVIALPEDDKKIGTEYKRFTDQFEGGKRKEALAALFHAFVVYPDKPTIARVVARRPGLAPSVGGHAAELLGLTSGFVKKD